jgi:hypothetical protein
MDRDLEKDETQASAFIDPSEAPKTRLKPGPKKIIELRSEKISCRLTKEERKAGLDYCKKYGINEARLLRMSYLYAISRSPDQIIGVAQKILNTVEESDLPIRKKWILKSNMKEILKKACLLLLLIVVATSLATSPTVAKYILHLVSDPGGIVYTDHNACVFHGGDEMGCELVPYNKK